MLQSCGSFLQKVIFVFQFPASCLEPPEEQCDAECDDGFQNETARWESHENRQSSVSRVAGKTPKAWYYGRKSGDKP